MTEQKYTDAELAKICSDATETMLTASRAFCNAIAPTVNNDPLRVVDALCSSLIGCGMFAVMNGTKPDTKPAIRTTILRRIMLANLDRFCDGYNAQQEAKAKGENMPEFIREFCDALGIDPAQVKVFKV